MRLLTFFLPKPLVEKNLDEFLHFEIYGLFTGEELTRKVTAAMRKLKLRNATATVDHSIDPRDGTVWFRVHVMGEVGFFRRRAASGVLERRVCIAHFVPGTTSSIIEFQAHATWGHGLITKTSWRKHN